MLAESVIIASATLFGMIVWFDTEIAAPVRMLLQRKLANAGWVERETGDGYTEIVPKSKRTAPYRWLWNLISCPMCAGVHLAFWLSVYLHEKIWADEVWLTFGAACGLFYPAVKLWQRINV